jgi:multidrug efflux system membrane fusion protein
MRLLSILTAALVMLALYGLIFERQRVLDFAASFSAQDSAYPAMPDDGTPQTLAGTALDDAPALDDPAEAQDIRRVSVRAQVFTARSIEDGVLLRGRTEANRHVEVRAETGGLVVSEPLRKGTSVAAGDLLCRLDPGTRPAQLADARAGLARARATVPEAQARLPEARARVAEAEARLEEARINDNAARELVRDGFATETRVAATKAGVSSAQAAVQSAKAGVSSAQAGIEAASAGVESAQAAVAAVEKDIERLEIRAPFAGLLETDTAELGALMQPASLCANIIALDPIKLVGFVPEAEIEKVSVGAMAGARLITGSRVTGRVTFLSRAADPDTRTFRAEVTVPNADLSIRDGQTAEIVIAGAGRSAQLVPQSALTLNNSGTIGVRTVIEDDTGPIAHFLPVTVLRDTPEGVFVAGLPEEVAVITLGQEFVSDGVAVRVTYGEMSQ